MIRTTINGAARRLDVHPMKRVLDVLREDCGLTGTKEGCGEGECGACTIVIDGLPVNSCLVPAAQLEGRDGPHDRRPVGGRSAACDAGSVRHRGRGAVRHLHAGDDHGLARHSTWSGHGRDSGSARRQSVPLHRL